MIEDDGHEGNLSAPGRGSLGQSPSRAGGGDQIEMFDTTVTDWEDFRAVEPL